MLSDVGAGVRVQAWLASGDGSRGRAVASATTRADGSYELAFSADTERPFAVVEAGLPVPLRALATTDSVDVTPGSEAVLKRLEAIGVRYPQLLLGDGTRIGRFVRATTMFLDLIDVHAPTAADAVAELDAWLDVDDASVEAWAALQFGALPPTLGDVGGVHGVGDGAFVRDVSVTANDWIAIPTALRRSAGEPRAVDVHELAPIAGGFNWNDLQGEWRVGRPVRTLGLASDGLDLVAGTQPLSHTYPAWLSFRRLAHFGGHRGHIERLNEGTGITTGESLDGDAEPETFAFTQDQWIAGETMIAANGEPARAVDIWVTTEIHLMLSAGGSEHRTIVVRCAHVPFVGCVGGQRFMTRTTTSGRQESVLSFGTLDASIQGMQWPARVHVAATRRPYAPPPGVYPRPIAADGRSVTFLESEDGTSDKGRARKPSAIRRLDFVDQALDRSVAIVAGDPSQDHVWAMSHDRSRFIIGAPQNENGSHMAWQPVDSARGFSVLMQRFDLANLRLEWSGRLDPLLSSTGQALPRTRLGSVVPSPHDPRAFIVGADGWIGLFDGASTSASASLTEGLVESFDASGALTSADHRVDIDVLGWDATTNTVAYRYAPQYPVTQPTLHRLSVQPSTFSHAAAVPAVAQGPGMFQAPRPWFVIELDDRTTRYPVSIYEAGGSVAVSHARVDGRELGRSTPSGPCSVDTDGVFCLSNAWTLGQSVDTHDPREAKATRRLQFGNFPSNASTMGPVGLALFEQIARGRFVAVSNVTSNEVERRIVRIWPDTR